MLKIVVVFHSGYGHTLRMAHAIAEGSGAQVIDVDDKGEVTPEEWEALNHADAIIMGSPTYMGSVSWQFKKFADATSKIWLAQGWKDKIFAGFIHGRSRYARR